MARNEEIDNNDGGKKEATVMVGGMDHLVPGGKDKADDGLTIEIEQPKPKEREAEVETKSRRRDLDEDARLAYDEGDDDEVEERGLSRRQRRNRGTKRVIAGRDQVIDQLNAKVDALTGMINSMGQSQVGITIQNIDTQLGAAQQALTLADTEIKKAVAAGDLARYDELQALRSEAQSRVWQLSRTKNGIQQEMQQGGRVRQPAQAPNGGGAAPASSGSNLNQRAQDFTETFMSRFPDFDPNSTDEDTLVMKAIDDSVAAEGYRPDTPLYWRELEKRLAARGIYPDNGDDDDDDDQDRRRVVRREERPAARRSGGRPPTSGGGANRRGTGSTFRLDPMMRDYLESEGILHLEGLDDNQKAKRGRLIKSWQDGQRSLRNGDGR